MPDDGTPLEEEEKEGLIPAYISTRVELNEAEQKNINDASLWAFQKKHNPLDQAFLKRLHKRMFGKVWTWAGAYRKTERNIGIAPYLIAPETVKLIDDVKFLYNNLRASRLII